MSGVWIGLEHIAAAASLTRRGKTQVMLQSGVAVGWTMDRSADPRSGIAKLG
jgi:hypothetical protein